MIILTFVKFFNLYNLHFLSFRWRWRTNWFIYWCRCNVIFRIDRLPISCHLCTVLQIFWEERRRWRRISVKKDVFTSSMMDEWCPIVEEMDVVTALILQHDPAKTCFRYWQEIRKESFFRLFMILSKQVESWRLEIFDNLRYLLTESIG